MIERLENTGKADRTRRREGVAIILVLGMMGIFLISATAFSIAMRVERRGASNYRYTVRSRHILWAALMEAMADINASIATNEVYPTWPVLGSVGSDTNDVASLVSRSGSKFIPADLIDQVNQAKPQWRILQGGGGSGQVLGRYAFLALNTSGYLDANLVGGGVPRARGSSPAEIRVDKLPEIGSPGAFTSLRDDYYRFETLSELSNLRPGFRSGYTPESFCVYSLARLGEARLAGGTSLVSQVSLKGDPSQGEWNFTDVSNALVLAGIPNDTTANGVLLMYNPPSTRRSPQWIKASNVEIAMVNMRDYVDTDSEPRRLAVYYRTNGAPRTTSVLMGVDNVPMLSEVVAQYVALRDAAGDTKCSFGMMFEWHYPFITPNPSTYVLEYWITTKPNPDPAKNKYAAAVPGSFHGVKTIPANVTRQFGFLLDSKLNFSTLNAAEEFNVCFDIDVKVQIKKGGTTGLVVDEVPSPWIGAPLRLWKSSGYASDTTFLTVATNAGSYPISKWVECLDPRFNHVADFEGMFWVSGKTMQGSNPGYQPTMNTTNNFTRDTFAIVTAYDMDRDIDMHVANQGFQTIGELGLICYDTWRTVRLYKHDKNPLHPVFDYFTLVADTNQFVRGRVNINSTNVNVLGSVFYKAPLNEFDAMSPTISWAQATNLAAAITTNGPFERVSDAFMSPEISVFMKTFGRTEFERESVIRNSMDLFTVRHNLFTIFLSAESFSEAIGGYTRWGGNSLARARAVAEVWRDPFVDNTGATRSFVRYYRVFDD